MKLSYRPVAHDDLALLRGWIASPHWQKWWGDVDREIAYVEDMLNDKDTTKPFIFMVDDEPVGYIQYWSIKDQIAAGWADEEQWLKLVPETSIGVDLSIGPVQKLEKGIGSAILWQFTVDLVKKGFDPILIDPEIGNDRAIAAYKKAGYRIIESLVGKTGDSLIMHFDGHY